VAAALVTIFLRSLFGGRVVSVAMKPDEAAFACASAPWQWSRSQRVFTPWPLDRVRDEPVTPPSLADEARPRASEAWELGHEVQRRRLPRGPFLRGAFCPG
jgi:hypothetical protein